MTLYGSDREILDTAVNWLNAGFEVILVTVAKTWGSSPRPCGSMMIIRNDGIHAGSVSGGCIEEDLLARSQNRELAESFPTMIDYGVNREDATRFGLPCGGRLELLVEKLDSATPLMAILQTVKEDELIARRVCLNTGEVSLHPATTTDQFNYRNDDEQAYLQKVFGPSWELLLIGAGHLSHYVAQIALMLDYRVSICDPRTEYKLSWQLEGIHYLQDMPDDAVKKLATHKRSIVVALTHDPKLDGMALMEALTSQAFYVGALGSQRNNQKRLQQLAQLGLTQAQLDRLHAPVGLPIGSHTPPEIALSIMAEITAARNNVLINSRQALKARC